MTWLEAVILGLVQGLTEFLPISSSAHLRILGDLMGSDPGAAFTAITQLGTETAVIVYFRKDIVRIIKAWFGALPFGPWRDTVPRSDPDARLGWFVILGSVPIVLLGILLENAIDSTFRNLYLTVTTLVVFALILWAADATSRRTRTLDRMTGRHALYFGLAQALALIPGVSRSGGTITAGLLMGYTREAAARYSFLLAIPAVMGSGFYKLFTEGTGGGAGPGALATAVATLVAFLVGYVVIVWFLKLVSTHSYLPFVIYRIVLAAVVLVLLGAGLLEALPSTP